MHDPQTWTAVAFWLGLALVGSVWILAAARTRRAALETVRTAIERGQPLDTETVRLLLAEKSTDDKRREFLVQACVWLGLGAGFMIWGLIGFEQVHRVILGLGAVLASLGGGFLAVARLFRAAAGAREAPIE